MKGSNDDTSFNILHLTKRKAEHHSKLDCVLHIYKHTLQSHIPLSLQKDHNKTKEQKIQIARTMLFVVVFFLSSFLRLNAEQ
jgi:fructose/tagatose bisphosphate aldolase